MDYESAKRVDYARMGFGQAIAVTPIQQINAISSVINGGILMQPYFVDKITNSNNQVMLQNTPTQIRRVVSQKTSETIKVMYEEVIKKANGINAFIPGFRVSGKTGTTELFSDGKKSSHHIASFVGAFPSNNPQYVCLVIVNKPTSGSYYGSIVATPYAKKIFEGIIKYKNLTPNNLEEDLKLMEEKITMPNLVGLSLSKAVSTLKNLNLQYELDGEGGVILKQTPAPNTKLRERAIVLLET